MLLKIPPIEELTKPGPVGPLRKYINQQDYHFTLTSLIKCITQNLYNSDSTSFIKYITHHANHSARISFRKYITQSVPLSMYFA